MPLDPEKRRESRLPLEVRVQLHHGEVIVTHLCSDLSSGGLFVRSDNRWPAGTQMQVRVFLPRVGVPISLPGEVVRAVEGPHGGMAIRFLETSRELTKFCENRGAGVIERAKKRILLAFAKEDMRFFLRTVLGGEGYRISECKSTDEAAILLKDEWFDLLVGDPLLDARGGGTLAGWLKEHPFHGPVVMVTGGEMLGDSPLDGQDFALVTEPVELGSFRTLVWDLVK